MEEIRQICFRAEEKMKASIQHLQHSFSAIRAGRASAAMIQSIMVDYYGMQTPLSQVANITAPDGMTLSIQPWEKTTLPAIEKAIFQANIGLTPTNNGETIIISIPPLTEQRRTDLSKQAKSESETAKIGVRKARQEANLEIKQNASLSEDLKKDAEEQIQDLTTKFIKEIDAMLVVKGKEIMTV